MKQDKSLCGVSLFDSRCILRLVVGRWSRVSTPNRGRKRQNCAERKQFALASPLTVRVASLSTAAATRHCC